MFKRLFNWHHLEENRYELGCHDRDSGRLPRRQDTAYLKGYLSDRPRGLDNEIQYFPTIEGYLYWKKRY